MTLTEIRQALAHVDSRPRQSLGQNFLVDENVAQSTVAQLGLQPGDHAVEIGPGLGSLTEWIASQPVTLTLIEKDRSMVQWLREKYTGSSVELFHEDGLEFDLRRLYGKGPVKAISNLPYYVSTPLISMWTSALSPASILVVTLQHELAARLCGVPRTKEYGAMTVCSSRRWKIEYVKKLPPTIFFPAPNVFSAVVVFTRKPASEVPPCDEQLFEKLVRRGFSERRKQLRKMLPEFRPRWDEVCALLDMPETMRAEELSLAQWERLTQWARPRAAQSGEELFNVVDEQDEVIDVQPRATVHVNNLRHRAVHMLIFNQAGELLLQKRSIWKDRNPGVWDSSAAGHVDAGETYAEAAVRELSEELEVLCELIPIGKLPCSEATGWEFIEVFVGTYDGKIRPAPMEIDATAFFPIEQIKTWLERSPGEFSPVFPLVVEVLKASGRFGEASPV